MIARGFLIGASALINFKFDQSKPYAACRICGEAFQSDANRMGSKAGLSEWRIAHNKLHSDREHIQLIKSRRYFTPEAAHRLAPLGIIDLGALVLDEEYISAYREAARAPNNDVEGS